MEVAVIVPVYNRQATVPQTLDSVARQTFSPARLIVVDDGSTDGTAQAVQHWQRDALPPFEVRIVRQANQGAGAARNAGLAETGDTPLVAFLDSDDIWPNDFLQRTIAAMANQSDAVAVSTDFVVVDPLGRVPTATDVRPVADDATWWFFGNGTALTSCTVLSTAVIRRLGGFRVDLCSGQDIELFLRVSLEGPWLHALGAPVHYCNSQVGDEGHLSQSHPDCAIWWAELRDDYVTSLFGNIRHASSAYRRALSRFWHQAGREMLQQGRSAMARQCLWRAIQLRPLKRRAWWNLAESFVR